MDDDAWRAPGREGTSAADVPAHDGVSPYPPSGADAPTGPAAPASPYARPGPYAGPGPHAGPGPYAAPGAQPGPHAAPGVHPGPFAASTRHSDQVFAGAGYHTPAYRNDRVAVTAMVLGIVGIVVPGVFLFAIALGHLALRRLRTAYEGGRGLAIAGLALGYGMAAIWLFLVLLFLVLRASL